MKTKKQIAAEVYSEKQSVTILEELTIEQHFLAGFEACEKMLREASDEFDDSLTKKTMHEFAMQNLGEVQRIIFERGEDEIQKEMFGEELAAGQGFYMGARWQHSQDQMKIQATRNILNYSVTLLKDRDQRIQELEAEVARLKEYKAMYEGLCK